MNDSSPPNLGLIDGVPARELLDGLGELHGSVLVTDERGLVVWTSRCLDRLTGGRVESVDKPLATLCQRFMEGTSSRSKATMAPPLDVERLSARIEGVLSQLEEGETIVDCALLDAHDRCPVELSAFRVESSIETHGKPWREAVSIPLYVVILRPRPAARTQEPAPGAIATEHRPMLDEHPEATLTIDPLGFINYTNTRAAELLGANRESLIDTPITAHLPMRAMAPAGPQENSHRDTSDPERSVVEVTQPDGQITWIEVSSRPFEDLEGAPLGRVLSLRDATQQQHMIERFKQKIHSLESYVHTVSHDLRSPLVALLGFTRLMKQDYAPRLDEKGYRFLERIEQAGTNMNRMTRDLLELSTRDADSSDTPPVCDPRDVLLEVQAELKPRLEERGISLLLPSAPPLVQCDRTQLYQIFSNLVGNAVRHMGDVPDPQIEITIGQIPEQRVIVVRDNGRGINEDVQPKIFDAFHSVPRGDEARSTGVGLSIVKKIAHAHGGRVDVESAPGEGATFTVVIEHR
ncbi:MAG: PAS domain-containing sensor histidine kinase [Myxococcota bacterium]|jgi:PAS domain S-box-containing protein|nr:PAS domain-containing sensor histidine kinase [Myxococcota bacterium]